VKTGLELFGLLREAVQRVCDVPGDVVTPESTLASLGIDSLAVAEIIVEIEIALDRELPMHVLRRLDTASTLGDVASELEAALGDPAH
jgi:acyl carrier protein